MKDERNIKRIVAITCLIAILLSSSVRIGFAQDGILKVQNGKIADSELFKNNRYAMPSFSKGIIMLKDRRSYSGIFNIDNCSQTLRMIDEKGDTVTVAAEDLVVSLSAGGYLFLKIKNNYVQILDTDGETSLGVVRQITFGRKVQEGVFGITNDIASMNNIVSTEDNFYYQIEKGLWSGSVPFNYKEQVFFVKDGKLFPVNKPTLKKFYPKKYPEIEKYISEHNPDLSKREDVSLLYKFVIR